MKTIKLKFIALLIVFITCAGFTSWNREEEARLLNNNTAIVADKCFSNFMKGMNGLGAILYIPDTKLEKGKELGLTPVLNSGNQTETYEFYSFFDQISPIEKPGDECSSSLLLTLNDLQMIVYVDKRKSTLYKQNGIKKVDFKYTGINYKLVDKHKTNETLMLKLDNNASVNLVPVSWTALER